MNFYFVYDEYTDVLDIPAAWTIARLVIDIMRDPESELGDPNDVLAGLIREYVPARASRIA